MRRTLVVFIFGLSLLALVAGREWLIRQEIQSLQENTRAQISDHLNLLSDLRSLKDFDKSSQIYHRYIEPVVNTSSRLLWPNAREDLVSAWTRELFSQIEVSQVSRMQTLKAEFSEKQKMLREGKEASSQRLIDLVAMSEALDPQFQCASLVKAELDEIQANGQKRDIETLAQVKETQKAAISRLRERIRGMSESKLGKFLSSRAYQNEILAPVQDQILKVRQEKLRREALQSFDNQIFRALNKHRGHIEKSRELRSEKITKLLEPLAETDAAIEKFAADTWKALQ